MSNYNPVATPAVVNENLVVYDVSQKVDVSMYQSLVRPLIYLIVGEYEELNVNL